MEPRHRLFHDQQLAGRRLVAQVILRLPMGDRIYGFLDPDLNEPIGTVLNTSEATFTVAEFSGTPVIERSARLVALSPLNESIQPLDQDVLASWGQAQRTTLEFELENGDREMTRLAGQEFLLNQPVFLFVGFPGLGWDKAQQRYRGTVNRVVLTKNTLRIEAETLC